MGCECATILDISGKCLYFHRALNDESMKHAQDSFAGKIRASKQSNNLMTNILTQLAESHECLHCQVFRRIFLKSTLTCQRSSKNHLQHSSRAHLIGSQNNYLNEEECMALGKWTSILIEPDPQLIVTYSKHKQEKLSRKDRKKSIRYEYFFASFLRFIPHFGSVS